MNFDQIEKATKGHKTPASSVTMSDPELRLDPAIRLWVFLPIVAITFLVGIVRHYVSVLLSSAKKVDLAQVKDR